MEESRNQVKVMSWSDGVDWLASKNCRPFLNLPDRNIRGPRTPNITESTVEVTKVVATHISIGVFSVVLSTMYSIPTVWKEVYEIRDGEMVGNSVVVPTLPSSSLAVFGDSEVYQLNC